MKAIILKETGDAGQLAIAEMPKPAIKDNEVLVKVKAISINPVDVVVRSIPDFQKFVLGLKEGEGPIILGWDISGEVVEAGNAVKKFEVGDEVLGLVNFTGHGKAYAEYVAAPEAHLALKPANISHPAAAAATLTALSAWQSLVAFAGVKQGDKVLIHAAAGGVGHLAVQIAKAFGAYVIGTGSAQNKDFILSLGADEFIDYKQQAFENVVNNADIILDGISLTTEHLHRSVKALKNGGKLISMLAFFDDDLNKAMNDKNIKGHRLSVLSNGEQMDEIAKLLESGKLKPHVAHVYGFDKIKEAHQQIETGKTRGKVILDPAL